MPRCWKTPTWGASCGATVPVRRASYGVGSGSKFTVNGVSADDWVGCWGVVRILGAHRFDEVTLRGRAVVSGAVRSTA